MRDNRTTELLPCPFCGNEPERQHFNISPHLQGRIICSCGAEMRQGRNQTSAELVAAWNARTCGEEGAVPMTEENMAAHGWVRERTCFNAASDGAWFVCSNCGHNVTANMVCGYCTKCGARVVEQ